MSNSKQNYLWTLTAAVVGTAVGLAAREVVAKGWEATMDEPAPSNPADGEVTWGDALVWAAVSGMVVGVSRVLAKRGVAGAWEVRQGKPDGSWERREAIE